MIAPRRNVLVVDDSKIWLDKISTMLHEMDCIETVFVAGNYDEAIPLLDASLDFIFLDIHMPGKNGIELLRFIKRRYSKPKICMVSNSLTTITRKLWKSLGADESFDKSIEFQQIPDFIINNVIP